MENLLTVSLIVGSPLLAFNIFVTIALVRRVNLLQHMLRTVLSPHEGQLLPIGQPAPSLTALTLRGEALQLPLVTASKGNRLLVFVAPTCPHCHTVMPEVADLEHKLQQQGDVLILVSLGDREHTHAFVTHYGFRGSVIPTDYKTPLADAYKVAGTPMYYLVNAKGLVQSAGFVGDDDWQTLYQR